MGSHLHCARLRSYFVVLSCRIHVVSLLSCTASFHMHRVHINESNIPDTICLTKFRTTIMYMKPDV